MKSYQSNPARYDNENAFLILWQILSNSFVFHDRQTSNEDDALINRPTPIPDRSPFYKRYPLIAVVALCFLLAYNLVGTNQDNAPNKADAAAFLQDNPPIECQYNNDDCGSGKFCCRNKCQSCCMDRDCTQKMEFLPPAGEFGDKLCIDGECTPYKNGEFSQIPPEGYPVYTPSETLDNSKKFRKYSMPRTVYDGDGPIMEQVWRIDFSQQDESFDKDNKFEYNGSHITIPSFDHLHAAYSRSYNHFDEHETGISTLIMADNKYSLVADFPELIFIEKYHTLTYDGKIDTARGDYIKKKAKEQMGEQPAFDKAAWQKLAQETNNALGSTTTVQRQVEAGLDQAIATQVRRYARSYPVDDFGSLNANTSDSWAKHSELAKKAIDHAKDPSFERDYLKSELHCKHFEEIEGLSYTEDTITFPLGRPITGFTGEMVNSPVHYFGLGVGYITLEYDPNTQILEIFYQTFAHARQHSDVAFPGPYPNGLYVTPVSDGDDYAVSSTRDGRTDGLLLSLAPPDNAFGGEADFTLWARQTEDFCDQNLLPYLNLNDGNVFDYGTEAELQHQLQISSDSVSSMPCATTYMRTDYGGGTNFDVQDFGVWYHSFIETRPGRNEEMLTATFWDEWQCFYADKCD
mmetsp:Transcript_15149/g.17021  ORF Transcript_15149/g.17021 Transcript_15149/m.17021 type:complete len:632 (+) Transcript_15149:269-2164(+)